jgi:hypothetical protein
MSTNHDPLPTTHHGIATSTSFDRRGPDTNLLIRQVTRRDGRLSLRATLWLAFGLGIFSTMLTLSSTVTDFSLGEQSCSWLVGSYICLPR